MVSYPLLRGLAYCPAMRPMRTYNNKINHRGSNGLLSLFGVYGDTEEAVRGCEGINERTKGSRRREAWNMMHANT